MGVCDVGWIWSERTNLEVRMDGMEKEKGLRAEEGKKSPGVGRNQWENRREVKKVEE